MDFRLRCVVFVVIVSNAGFTLAQQTTTDANNISAQTVTPDENVTTEEFTSRPTENDTASTTEMPTVPAAPTALPMDAHGCLCDLTPNFCDIGCCCDSEDCDVANLSSIFTGCPQKAIEGVCIEKYLMFRANVDSSLITVTDSLFCVQPAEKPSPTTVAASNYSALGDSYHFAPPKQMTTTFTRDFYRVDDLILTYFPNTSARGVLRQPSPGFGSTFCINRNPAQFLRSSTFSCTRKVNLQSCSTDPALNARSYIHDLHLIKHPIRETDPVTELLIPVTSSATLNSPMNLNNSCVDVVKVVEFIIGYTERGEISSANVNVVLVNVNQTQLLLQTHTVEFQLITQTPPVSKPTPAVGLKIGSPVIGRFFYDVEPLTVIGVSQSGACSEPNKRKPILFGHNSISGCTFKSMVENCSDLRTQMYEIHRGVAIPELVAMNSGSQPDWTRVVSEECTVGSQDSCDTGCMLPHSLSVRVLWAPQGLPELPQNHILGVKYVFHCRIFKCPITTHFSLSNEVTFTSLNPGPPPGAPQPQWRFPFGFFSRGIDEADGHVLSHSIRLQNITWIVLISTIWKILWT